MSYRLYWGRTTGAFAPEAILAEIGAPFERLEINWRAGGTRTAGYMKVNPLGQLPVLELQDGTVITESGAICLYLAEQHCEAGLLPPGADPARGSVYRWILFGAVNLYEVELQQYLGDQLRLTGDCLESAQAARAEAINQCWSVVEGALIPGPFILGERFSVADIYLAMIAGWQMEKPKMATSRPGVARMVDLVRARPAIAPIWQEHYGHKGMFQK
jgi:GST-like protein